MPVTCLEHPGDFQLRNQNSPTWHQSPPLSGSAVLRAGATEQGPGRRTYSTSAHALGASPRGSAAFPASEPWATPRTPPRLKCSLSFKSHSHVNSSPAHLLGFSPVLLLGVYQYSAWSMSPVTISHTRLHAPRR